MRDAHAFDSANFTDILSLLVGIINAAYVLACMRCRRCDVSFYTNQLSQFAIILLLNAHNDTSNDRDFFSSQHIVQ